MDDVHLDMHVIPNFPMIPFAWKALYDFLKISIC